MSENHAFVTVLLFLEEYSLRQYNVMVCMTPSTNGGIIYWLEAVQYFLTSCAQAKDTTKAVRDLRDTKKNQGVTRKSSLIG